MSYAQSISAGVTSASSTLTLASPVVSGHTLLVAIRLSNNSDLLTGVSSSINGALTAVIDTNNTAASIRTYLYKLEGASAGTHVITATFSSSQTFRWILAEYSEPSVDAAATANLFASTTTPVSNSVTSTVSGDTIVSIVSLDSASSSIAAGGSETLRQNVAQFIELQDLGVGGLGSYSGSWALGAARAGVALAVAMKASILPVQPLPSGARQTFVNVIYEQY